MITECISSISEVLLAGAGIFTAWWAYKSFAFKDMVSEIKEITGLISKIKTEAFFIQQLHKLNPEKSQDITNLFRLIESFDSASMSLFYVKDETREACLDLSDFMSKDLMISVISTESGLLDKSKAIFYEKAKNVIKLMKIERNRYA